jgi:hypothetical protein
VNDQTIGLKITMIKMEFAKVSRGREEKILTEGMSIKSYEGMT